MINVLAAPEYQAFYNDEALKIIDWMFAENNRAKQAKLYRTACKMEYRFRKYHGIPENSPWRRGNVITLPVGMRMRDPKLKIAPPKKQGR